MSKLKEKLKKEIDELDEDVSIAEVPPYTKISVSIGSEGFHLELEENEHFEDTLRHYVRLVKEVTETKLLKSKKTEKSGVDIA